MKTSNKILSGLFILIIVIIIAVNFLLKNEISSNPLRNPAVQIQVDNVSTTEQDTLITE